MPAVQFLLESCNLRLLCTLFNDKKLSLMVTFNKEKKAVLDDIIILNFSLFRFSVRVWDFHVKSMFSGNPRPPSYGIFSHRKRRIHYMPM